MRKTKLIYSLALAPLLLGGYSDSEIDTNASALAISTSLPKCADSQFLVYRNNAIVCETITSTGTPLPDCKSSGQLLTYTKANELAGYSCVDKGSIKLSTTDITTIMDLQNQVTQIGTKVTAIGKGTRVAARTFLGVTDVANATNGNLGGVDKAAATCAAKFGPGTAMCDVYSIYVSIAAGKLDTTKDITGAWVYQASLTNPFGGTSTDLSLGMGDNCAGYTSAATGGGMNTLAGTKFVFAAPMNDAANRVPKFYSNTTCDTKLPIACCQ